MANIREISGRIRSIRDTMKITNAMYMISSTKLRRAKKEADGNLPYFKALQVTLAYILTNLPDVDSQYLDLRQEKPETEKTRAILVITADKGLAGSYNHNVLKLTDELLDFEGNTKLYVVGEVGRQYYASKKVHMDGQFKYTAQNPNLDRARVISEMFIDEFMTGKIDEVYIAYTQLGEINTSEAAYMKVLPMTLENVEDRLPEGVSIPDGDLNFVPNAKAVLENVAPNILVGDVYSALVGSYCSEQNDRMMAMDAANRNAQEMIHSLSVEYNRERQAMITQEITEVIAGAKAQKKKKMCRREVPQS